MAAEKAVHNPVSVPKDFLKEWRALLRDGKRSQYHKVGAAMTEAQISGQVLSLTRTKHGEGRLPDAEKYDLGDGYRLLIQRLQSTAGLAHYVFLHVGTHDEMESWLENRKGHRYVSSRADREIAFIPFTPSGSKPSAVPPPSECLTDEQLDVPVLGFLEEQDWQDLEIEGQNKGQLLSLTISSTLEDGFARIDSIEDLKDNVKACLFDVFACALQADEIGKRKRLQVFKGEARVLPFNQVSGLLRETPIGEEFVTFNDAGQLEEFKALSETSRWREWLTYLHPEQAHIVTGDYHGPAMVRGVSGSGKTSLAVHRARFLARKYATTGAKIYLVTYNYTLKALLENLIRDLCGAELSQIRVFTIQELAKSLFGDLTGDTHPRILLQDECSAELKKIGQSGGTAELALHRLDRTRGHNSLTDELAFLRTHYTYADRHKYITDDLSWKEKPFEEKERKDLCEIALAFETQLSRKDALDSDGMLLRILDILVDRSKYATIFPRAIVADEVQDFSPNELRLLASIAPKRVDNPMFLVGDGAQRVYRREFSLASAGISVENRAFVLLKSYRNTRQIMDAAHHLISNYSFMELNSRIREKPLAPDFPAREGEKPRLIKFLSEREESIWVAEEVKRHIVEGICAPGEILVLSGTQRMRDSIRRDLEEKQIPVGDLRDNIEVDSQNVRISTIESAKGHESPVVFVTGLVEGAVPWLPVDQEGERINASRLYVAMTRARDALVLTWSTVNLDGKPRSPSRYLGMIQSFCREFAHRSGTVVPIGHN